MGDNKNKPRPRVGPDKSGSGTFDRKIEAERTVELDEFRRNELLLLLRSAATLTKDKKIIDLLKDPVEVDRILGFIEHQEDGSERYISRGVQDILDRMKAGSPENFKQLEAMKQRVNAISQSFVESVDEGRNALKAAQELERESEGSLLQGKEISQVIDGLDSSDTIAEYARKRSVIIEVARDTVFAATSRGMTCKQLLTKIEARLKNDTISSAYLEQIRAILVIDGIVTPVIRDDILKILKEASRLSAISPELGEGAMSLIDEELMKIDLLKKNHIRKEFPAREVYNYRLGGSDADTLINFAIVGKSPKAKIDFDLLHQQLQTLGVDISIDDLVSNSGLSLEGETSLALVPDDWEREPLSKFLIEKGLDNPAGISISNIYTSTREKLLVRQMTERMITESTSTEKIDVTLLTTKLNAIDGLLPQHEDDVRKFAEENIGEGGLFSAATGKHDFIEYLWEQLLITLEPDGEEKEEHKKAVESAVNDAILKGKWLRFVDFNTKIKSVIGDKTIEVRNALSLNPDNAIPANWDNARLIIFLQEKIQEKANGERESMVKFVENESIKGITLGAAKILDEFKLSGVGPGEVVLAAGLDSDAVIPDDWDSSTLVAFIRAKKMENLTGEKFDAIDISWDEQVKEYTGTASSVGAVAVKKWWEWIASLPKNVYEKNDDLSNLIDRERALNNAKKIIANLSNGFSTKSDDAFENAFESLRTLQDIADDRRKEVPPARTIGEKSEQSKDLLIAYKFARDSVKDIPEFNQLRNDAMRTRAIFYAMQFGLPEAVRYLRNPEVFELEDIEKSVLADEYSSSVREQRLTSGKDILDSMNMNYGIGVSPMAHRLLTNTHTPDGVPVAVGDSRVSNWLTHPEFSAPALNLILIDKAFADERNKNNFIHAFATQTDIPGFITAAQANEEVSRIQEHLMAQAEDYQRNANLIKADVNAGDPLNLLRGGWDSVTDMLRSGDPVEKVLAIGLIVGVGYALYKGFQRGGLTRGLVVGLPILFGADIALKRATGQGVMERLGLTYMNEKDRNSSFEQFIRSNSATERYKALKTTPGRLATKELMDPKDPVALSELLHWRSMYGTTGTADYSVGAPASLSTRVIEDALGTIPGNNYQGAELKGKAYELMFLSFEAFCVQVARTNGRGGTTLHERAQRGADLLSERYVHFNEPYMVSCNIQPDFKAAVGTAVTMREAMTWESPVGALRDALANPSFLEFFAAKFDLSVDFVKQKLKEGYTWGEIQLMRAREHAPKVYVSAKAGVLDSAESFMKWQRPTWYKVKGEVTDDVYSSYKFTKDLCVTFGIQVYEITPGVLSWTFDAGADGVEWTTEKVIAAWDEMHNHQITGPVAVTLESFFGFLLSKSVKNVEALDIADVDTIEKDMITLLERTVEITGDQFKPKVDEWLKHFEIADPTVPGLQENPNTTPHFRLMKLELLKREVYSYIAAQRIVLIDLNKDIATYKPDAQRLRVILPSFEIGKNTFDLAEGDIKDAYIHIRSVYSNEEILPLIGQGRSWSGNIEDYAKMYPEFYTGKGAKVLDGLSGWLFRSKADEFTTHGLQAYIEPLKKEAKEILTDPKDYEHYERYLDTLAVNVLMETALQRTGPEPADLALSLQNAKKYLVNLRTLRGNAANPKAIVAEEKTKNILKEFAILPEPVPSALKRVLAHPRAKWYLAGVEPPGSAPAASVPAGGAAQQPQGAQQSTPQENLPTETIDDIIKNAKMNKLEDTKSLLTVLGSNADAAQQNTVRQKFEDATPGFLAENPSLTAANQDIFSHYLLGTSDAQVKLVEDAMLSGVSTADDLSKLNPLDSFKDTASVERREHMKDRATYKVLLPVAEAIAGLDQKNLPASAEAEIPHLVMMMNASTEPDMRDAASYVLEYILCAGDWNNMSFEEYNKYLSSNGVLEPMPERSEESLGAFSQPSCYDRFTYPEKISGRRMNGVVKKIAPNEFR